MATIRFSYYVPTACVTKTFLVFNILRLLLNAEAATTEAATRGALQIKLFLKMSQISPENTCVTVSLFNKVKVGLLPSKKD